MRDIGEERTKKKGIAMNDTYIKLREAKDFFNRMKKVRSKPGEFLSNLQSFLSSARSVILIMQKEFSKKLNFKEWFKREQREMQFDEMISFFHRIERVRIRKWGTRARARAKGAW